MSTFIATKNHIETMGRGATLTAAKADEIVAVTPEDFDHTKRGAVADLLRQHVEEGQRMTGPKGDQRKTNYGVGFAALESAVKSRLVKRAAGDKPTRLAITLSGETSGSATVDPDTNLGRLMLAALAGEEVFVDGDAWEQITKALAAAGF